MMANGKEIQYLDWKIEFSFAILTNDQKNKIKFLLKNV